MNKGAGIQAFSFLEVGDGSYCVMVVDNAVTPNYLSSVGGNYNWMIQPHCSSNEHFMINNFQINNPFQPIAYEFNKIPAIPTPNPVVLRANGLRWKACNSFWYTGLNSNWATLAAAGQNVGGQ